MKLENTYSDKNMCDMHISVPKYTVSISLGSPCQKKSNVSFRLLQEMTSFHCYSHTGSAVQIYGPLVLLHDSLNVNCPLPPKCFHGVSNVVVFFFQSGYLFFPVNS